MHNSVRTGGGSDRVGIRRQTIQDNRELTI
jgi:hypothetical protein